MRFRVDSKQAAAGWLRSVSLAAWLVLVLVSGAGAQEEVEAGAAVSAEAASRAEIASLEALAEEWRTRVAELALARESAPEVLAAIDLEISELEQGGALDIDADAPLADLEISLLGVSQDLGLARKEVANFETEAAGRAERRKQIPELLTSAKERLAGLDGEKILTAGEPARAEAQQQLARLRREVLGLEIEAYEEEFRSYEVRGQLLSRRRHRAALRIAVLEKQSEALQAVLAMRRQGEAQVATEEAERLIASAEEMPPAVLERVRSFAEQNRELTLRRTGEDGLIQRIENTRRKHARAEAQVADVVADLEFLRRNVEVGGLSGSVGLVLRKTRSDVPDVGKYGRFIRMRRNQIAAAQLEQIELVERRQSLADVEKHVAKMLSDYESELTPEDRNAAAALLRDLLETQRDTLDSLIADTSSYFEHLVDFDARQRELVDRTEALLDFIDERVFWIPSGEPISLKLLSDARGAIVWLFSPRFWSQVARALAAIVVEAPLVVVCMALLVLLAPLVWPRISRRIVELGEQANDLTCIRATPTSTALLLSLSLAFWWPTVFALLAWRLGASVDATQFVRCVAHGMGVAALVWATLLIPRHLLRHRGIAEAHLGWPEAPIRDLRKHLRWFASVAVPSVFLVAVFEVRGEVAWNESLGRMAFLLIMGAVVVFNHFLLREGKGALRRLHAADSEIVLSDSAWRALHGIAVFVPLALIAAAMRGYYWTSLQLAVSLHLTLVFLVLVFFAQQFGARWFLLANRRLALRRWEEAAAALEEKRSASPDSPEPELEDPGVALATVDEHTHRILRNAAILTALVGVWMIWVDLLPAAGALRAVELWTVTETTPVEMTNAAGQVLTSVEDRLVPVTLADVLLALVIAAATLALVRNLPGLLEVSLFRQLRTSAGERYAYATIGTYAVTLTGAAVALSVVGVGWSSVQWLFAAVGIGLGFGLQEIFANFISGLMILFERPIRVGDTVTVGDVSGTVSKIRIRATWITSFDRKELVVPNKEFITSRLVNWSLSDSVLRADIPVGIAYGSDTELVSGVLQQVAKANEHVLQEPEPYVLFRGFGASSLDFELRVFSPDVARYLQIVHELHMEIDRRFRAEGIEIAFPQRDLHVRTLPVPRGKLESEG
jgi:potassium efflux system protein